MVFPLLPIAAGLFAAKKLYDYVTDEEESSSSYDHSSQTLTEAKQERETQRLNELTSLLATKRSDALDEIQEILDNSNIPTGYIDNSDHWEMIRFVMRSTMNTLKQIDDSVEDKDCNIDHFPRKFKVEFSELSNLVKTLEEAQTILGKLPSNNHTGHVITIDFGPDKRKEILKSAISKYGKRAGIDEENDYYSFDDPFIEKLESLA